MSLPWYEILLWIATALTKGFLAFFCRSIRLFFLRFYIAYILLCEVIQFIFYIWYPEQYNQILWVSEFVKYSILSMLITQIATLKESKVVAYSSFLILCGIISVLVFNTNLTITEPLLRTIRFIDVGCIGIALLAYVQKMDMIYKRLLLGLFGILLGDFICSAIQAYDHWKHWGFVRPLYAAAYLISLLVLTYLVNSGKEGDFQFAPADPLPQSVAEEFPAVPDLVPVQQQSLSQKPYLP